MLTVPKIDVIGTERKILKTPVWDFLHKQHVIIITASSQGFLDKCLIGTK